MPRFLAERNLWGVGEWPPEKLRQLADSLQRAAEDVGPHVEWVQSYVAEDTLYSVYEAPDVAAVRDLIHRARWSADRVVEVHTVLDRFTLEVPAGV
jgi:hypothetical protein